MSLKAKIEAVIYAAEEPVTLEQLAGLLGDEAGRALRTLEEEQGRLALEAAGEQTEGDSTAEAEPQTEMEADADGEAGAQPQQAESADAAKPQADTAGQQRAATRAGKERERAVREHLRRLLEELVKDCAGEDRGLEIREVAGGFRFATKLEYHDAVRGFVKALTPPLKLSLQALETLAVVAYKQPVTAPEISEIRGVDSGGVLGSLLGRKLITTAGRKQVVGRPILYRTTKDFLLRFGLRDTSELPSIEEFEKMASELAEQEEIPMSMMQAAGAETMHADPEMVRGGVEVPGVQAPGSDVVGPGDGGGSIDQPGTLDVPPSGADVTVPQSDGDSSALSEVTPDGRMSGVAPSGGDVPVDSPAGDAAIQSDEQR